jgi:hypothetical protein
VSTKNHYVVLDGLRGVASVTVVAFHLCETYSLGEPFAQVINHGYLAVDFFFCYPASSSPMPMTIVGARCPNGSSTSAA